MIGSIYGEYWNSLAVELLEDSARDIWRYHNPCEGNFEKEHEHPVGRNTRGCVECERFVKILMLLQGMEFKKTFPENKASK